MASSRVMKDLRTMEATETTKRFLKLIKKYPELYAVGHVDYKNLFKKELAWRKIQEQTNIDVKTMKAKWRNLRDTYKKYKQSRLANSGQSAKKFAHWQWAPHMSFVDSIKRQITNNPPETSRIEFDTSVSIKKENIRCEKQPTSNIEQFDIPIVHEHETVDADPSPEDIPPKRRRANEPADKTTNNVKLRKTENVSTNTSEELVKIPCDRMDMEFLGYANTVKTFSLCKQAIVKLQITNIITQAQLQELNNSRTNTNFSASSSNSNNFCYMDYDANIPRPIQSAEQSSYTDIALMQSPIMQIPPIPTFRHSQHPSTAQHTPRKEKTIPHTQVPKPQIAEKQPPIRRNSS